MGRRLAVAAPQPGYASRLALYLKEREPETEVAAFTHADTLTLYLQDSPGADLLVVQQSMLDDVRRALPSGTRIVVLVEGGASGEYEGLPAIGQYQPLPRLAAEIRRYTAAAPAVQREGAEVWTVYSAGGGAGKTTLALNLARQAAERGYSVMYLNLEALSGAGLLFGAGETDGLSRLLYELTAHPASAETRIRGLGARSSAIGAGYLDAADHPAELLAMTPERLEALIDALRRHGGFDLIVADPDGGFAGWQQRLLELSARICWIAADDAQLLRKTDLMLREWDGRLTDLPARSTLVLNKSLAEPSADATRLSGGAPWHTLPFVPQWKRVADMSALLGAPAFSGGVDRLLDRLGYARPGERTEPRNPSQREIGYPSSRSSGRSPGDGELRERPIAAGGGYR
ncbi:hypothetical protein [Cohnella sp. JJ-181]|uniref:nucleotide-binding protein n=1 Tax=Cohnella rhizoplanae TaxID=2974897 RepID=UPI0022FF7427|nr:hypothetical protein [Cohnella sp. JJ-181]CAI6079190.1 hypothetical protein COHCIP112018_02731 [Cohnella sp. JJ-181]